MVGILHDNKYAKDYPQFGLAASFEVHYTTNDGRFRVATIPGRVILMGMPNEHVPPAKYKPRMSDAEYPQYFTAKYPGAYVMHGGGISPVQGNYCKILDLKPGPATVEQDIVQEPGAALAVHIQDAQGHAVNGALVTGMSHKEFERPITVETDSCAAYSIEPGKPRLMVFFQPTQRLGGSVTLKGDEPQPVTVKLSPPGSVKGSLIDEDGKPLAGVWVDLLYVNREAEEIHAVVHKSKQIITDAKGAFLIDDVIPELKFKFHFRLNGRRLKPAKEEDIHIASKETRDVGTIKLNPFAENNDN
jgi:hypothetical protein